MSNTSLDLYVVLSLCIGGIVVAVVHVWSWIQHRRLVFQTFKRMGVPGPEPSLIKGNGELHWGDKMALDLMSEWDKVYGPIYGCFIGAQPILVIRDLDLVKQVLIKDFSTYFNRPRMHVETKPTIDTLVGLKGQRWKDVRSIMTPTFSMNKLKGMTNVMNSCITTLMGVLREKAEANAEFEVNTLVLGLNFDIISQCAFAMRIDCQGDESHPIVKAVRAFFDSAQNKAVMMAAYFPILASVMGYLYKISTSGSALTQICDHIRSVIRQRCKSDKKGHNENVDFLQLMLEATGSEKLSEDELTANALVLLLAGFETTGLALTYICFLLAKHPDIQERLLQEIEDNIEDCNLPDYDSVRNVAYLDMVINEALRLYPPVVLLTSRESAQESRLGKLIIPPGMTIQVPIWQIHRDPEIWPDPLVFKPERFSAENKASYHPMAHLPFGAGPRNCIGQRFASQVIKLTLVRVLTKFKLTVSENTEAEPQLKVSVVNAVPANGVMLKAVLR